MQLKTNLIHLTIAAGAGRGGVSIWAHLKRLDVWIEKGIMLYSIYFIATSKMPRAKTIVYDSLWNVHLNRWEQPFFYNKSISLILRSEHFVLLLLLLLCRRLRFAVIVPIALFLFVLLFRFLGGFDGTENGI